MLKLAAGAFCVAWGLFMLMALTGNLVWDNKLLWAPPALLALASFVGMGGLTREEHRVPLLLIAAASFCSMLAYAVFYFFLFGLVGR